MSTLEDIKKRMNEAEEARRNYSGEGEAEGNKLAYLAEMSSYDVPKLVAALEAVEAMLTEHAIKQREVSDLLNQQVMDREPHRDPEAASRYANYAVSWEAAQRMAHRAIEEALS